MPALAWKAQNCAQAPAHALAQTPAALGAPRDSGSSAAAAPASGQQVPGDMPGADRSAPKFIGIREVRNVVTWNRSVDLCAIR